MKRILLMAMLIAGVCTVKAQPNFTLKSDQISGQAIMSQVFDGFGCTGKNISPELSWVNAPAGTKSFAITLYDPNAPTGSGWWQWVIFDIPANVKELVQNAGDVKKELAPKGAIQIRNDYGLYGYGGPCPPADGRIHEYSFTIYALKVPSLGLKSDAGAPMVGFYIMANTIEKASLVMYYQRNK